MISYFFPTPVIEKKYSFFDLPITTTIASPKALQNPFFLWAYRIICSPFLFSTFLFDSTLANGYRLLFSNRSIEKIHHQKQKELQTRRINILFSLSAFTLTTVLSIYYFKSYFSMTNFFLPPKKDPPKSLLPYLGLLLGASAVLTGIFFKYFKQPSSLTHDSQTQKTNTSNFQKLPSNTPTKHCKKHDSETQKLAKKGFQELPSDTFKECRKKFEYLHLLKPKDSKRNSVISKPNPLPLEASKTPSLKSFLELPEEIQSTIFSYLPITNQCFLRRVHRSFEKKVLRFNHKECLRIYNAFEASLPFLKPINPNLINKYPKYCSRFFRQMIHMIHSDPDFRRILLEKKDLLETAEEIDRNFLRAFELFTATGRKELQQKTPDFQAKLLRNSFKKTQKCSNPSYPDCLDYLSNRKLIMIPREITLFKSSKVLRIGENEIKEINQNSISNHDLQYLFIHKNQIHKIDKEALLHLNDLQNLSFSGNQLKVIENIFPKTLTRLSLHDNQIEKIDPKAFSHLEMLETLLLQNNKIELINFELPVSLKALNFGNNNLKTINSDAFKSLKDLKILHLENNKIESIDNINFPKMLEEIDLYDNRIKIIDTTRFNSLENLSVFNIQKNPLKKIIKINNLTNCLLKRNGFLNDGLKNRVLQDEINESRDQPSSICSIL
jgi:Leucine-rich repeat (LRR) protein